MLNKYIKEIRHAAFFALLYVVLDTLHLFMVSNIQGFTSANGFEFEPSIFSLPGIFLYDFLNNFFINLIFNFDFKNLFILLVSACIYFIFIFILLICNKKIYFVSYLLLFVLYFLLFFSYLLLFVSIYDFFQYKNFNQTEPHVINKEKYQDFLLNKIELNEFNSYQLLKNDNYLILAENYPVTRITLFYRIVDFNYFNYSFLNKEDQFYRAYYWYNQGEKFISKDDPKNLINEYCYYYLFNRDKTLFCTLYFKKFNHIDLESTDYINVNDIKKRALLGDREVITTILNPLDKNSDEYLFWLLIGAENGNKSLQHQLGLLMQNTHLDQKKLNILKLNSKDTYFRGQFWLEMSKK